MRVDDAASGDVVCSALTARVEAAEMGGDLTAICGEVTGGAECMWCELLLPLLEWPTGLIPERGFPNPPKPASRPRCKLPKPGAEAEESFSGIDRS